MPHVGVDNVAAAAAATEYLLAHGRRRIAVIGVQERGSTATSRLRFQGYREALDRAGVPFDDALVGEVSHVNRAAGSTAASRLLESGVTFDGLFCFNDTMAFGAMYSLARSGVLLPDDVLVVGFDAIEEGRFFLPPLASVSTDFARTSGAILDLISAPERTTGGLHKIPFTLVERGPTNDDLSPSWTD